MVPYALGLGALLGALTQVSPLFFAGLIGGLWLPQAARWLGVLAYLAVVVHLGVIHNPWEGQYGRWMILEGRLTNGFLHTEQGRVYVRHFPRLQDGHYRLEGRLVRPQGQRNPGGFDQALWLRGLGVTAVLQAEAVLDSRPAEPGPRAWFERQLSAGLSPGVAALNTAITLGEKRDLEETYGEFQRAGLAHALALSGLNVAVLAGFLVLVLYKLGNVRYLVVLGVLLLYLLLVGAQPSLLRATVMAGFVLIGLFLGKGRVEVLPSLCLALFVHLLWEPASIFSLSFQLSYLAVLGMALILPKLPKLEGWRNWLWASVCVTVAAQALILPLLLHSFHQLPLVSPIANLLVLPLLELLIPLGFLKLVLGGLLALPVEVLSQVVLWMVGWLAQGPQLYWGQISSLGFALYFLGLVPLLAALYGRISWLRALVLSSTAVLASLLPLPFQRGEIWQLDVGQGDASLIRLPGNVSILVDGGRGFAYRSLEGSLRALGVHDLDLIVATHADADHIESLPQILDNFRVGTLVMGPRLRSDVLDTDLRIAAARRNVPVIQAGVGSTVLVDAARLRFVGPFGDEREDNERSLVFIFEYKGYRALFTGDADIRGERRWSHEDVDLLKVGHHGSRTSTSDTLLERFRPEVALIGVGNNSFGHPSKEVLDRLQRQGVDIRRTDIEGAIRIELP